MIFVLSLFFLDVQVFDFQRSPFHVLSKRLVCLDFSFLLMLVSVLAFSGGVYSCLYD